MKVLQWFFLFCLLATGNQVTAGNLHHHLMNSTRYNKRVRPATSATSPISITLGLSLHEIIDLSWFDSSLSWQPSDFNGIKKISLHTSDIWVPDIVVYNNADEGFGDGHTRVNAVIRHDGHVSLSIPFLLRSNCKVQLASYPFDVQVCSIKFGSWSFDGSQLALRMESPTADLSSYLPSAEWELIEIPGEFHSVVYACCANPYHDIEYMVKIRRRSLFYAIYLIIPCAMISMLTLLMFLLPPECNERMTVGMAILVGLSFFFLLVAENMPATAEGVPLIGIYYTVTLIEISVAFFMTCVVLRFHHYNPVHGEVPKWMKVYVIGTAARFLGFKFCNKIKNQQAMQPQMDGNNNEAVSMTTGDHEEKNEHHLNHRSNSSNKKPPTNKAEEESREAEKMISENIRKQDILVERQEEWRRAALVFNSLFMWTYFIAIVFSFAVLLLPQLIVSM
ncbi:neuronal acetylcholine receptor subunit alpha-7-like isoform X2 [Actinia tenebrosa]|uniref:Neuronal acetylcholine receptor subunit alpha-7-like isoform X2 n=1 Tax=Actinia tenebrosa TaxID=6105 RepID=A0A6P8IAV2_ACTTE|nr:neuronal acetylcholine receptor subunit alpha-7-like isoform X2 [Actinia tenebrosa]